ncbi:MAG: CHASE2 domain-containing protein [Candidatus Omnitrophica bacterium]|nr:CHASE2 domain-containing protein [Candidatus Omnitrophota bacterium]
MRKKKSGLNIGLICCAVIGLAYLLGFFELAEYHGMDILFRLRGPRPVSPEIVIIEIDDASLKAFGRWPWDRGYHAELLDIIEDYGPKTIIFDILFSEPQEDKPGEDSMLAEQTKKTGNVFYSSFFDLSQDNIRKNIIKPRDITMPLPELRESAKGVGFVNILVEPDGKVRKVPLTIGHDGIDYVSIDMLAAAHFTGVGSGKMNIHTDANGMMWINYPGEFARFKRLSFAEVALSGIQKQDGEKSSTDLGILKDKIVIIGMTATGSEDFWATPVSTLYPGVGIRASAVNTILRKDFVHRVFRPEILIILFVIGSALGTVLPKRTPVEGLMLFASLAAGILLVSYVSFAFFNIWIDYVTILVLLCVCYPAITLNQLIITKFEKGLIEKELQIASRIQQSILPQTLPHSIGIEIGVKCVPAKHVGGDFYDFIKLIYDFIKLKEDRLGVVIGDVSGKGVPAALYMAKAMADFRGLTHDFIEPNEAMTAINDRLVEEGVSGMFVTLQYLIYKPKERTVKYSNGGHNPLVWVKESGEVLSLTQSVGSPIGIIPGSEFTADEFKVSSGDVFVMYTDGISEARDRNLKEFGEKRILDTALINRRLSAQELSDKIVDETQRFSRGMPQHDDMTVIALKIV